MKAKHKEILQLCYHCHVNQKQTPFTPRDLHSLKPLLLKGLIETFNYQENGKVFVRFQISEPGIRYMMAQERLGLNAASEV